MDYNAIEVYCLENEVEPNIETSYKGTYVRWTFEGFDQLIKPTRFISTISLSLDFQMSPDTITDIENHIDEVQDFYNKVKQALQNYLDELDSSKKAKITRIYRDYLVEFYKHYKQYIDKGLVPYTFAEVFHEPIVHDTNPYDASRYLMYRFDKLKLKVQKEMHKAIKEIISLIDKDKDVFKLLSQSYEEQIQQTEQQLKTNKKLAQL